MKKEKLLNNQQDLYPVRLKNTLRSVFDRTQIPILNGTENKQEVLKARHLISELPEFPYDILDVSLDSARYRDGVVLVTKSLLEQENHGKSYIAGIGASDYHNLPAIASAITLQEEGNQTVTSRLVLGGTTEIQLRALSYFLPALNQMDSMSKKPLGNLQKIQPTQLQIIFANHLAADVNGLPYEVLREQAKQYTDISRAYIRHYFPKQEGNVIFAEDTEVNDKDSVIRNQLMQLQPVVAESLSEEIKNRLRSKIRAGDPDISLTYAAAHLLMHDTNMPGIVVPFDKDQAEISTPSMIISYGGAQEKDFYAVRQETKQKLQGELADRFTTVMTLQYFTRHTVPPYYAARNGDISLEKALNPSVGLLNDVVDKAAEFDLLYLDEISRQRGMPFGEFLKEYRKGKSYAI